MNVILCWKFNWFTCVSCVELDEIILSKVFRNIHTDFIYLVPPNIFFILIDVKLFEYHLKFGFASDVANINNMSIYRFNKLQLSLNICLLWLLWSASFEKIELIGIEITVFIIIWLFWYRWIRWHSISYFLYMSYCFLSVHFPLITHYSHIISCPYIYFLLKLIMFWFLLYLIERFHYLKIFLI